MPEAGLKGQVLSSFVYCVVRPFRSVNRSTIFPRMFFLSWKFILSFCNKGVMQSGRLHFLRCMRFDLLCYMKLNLLCWVTGFVQIAALTPNYLNIPDFLVALSKFTQFVVQNLNIALPLFIVRVMGRI